MKVGGRGFFGMHGVLASLALPPPHAGSEPVRLDQHEALKETRLFMTSQPTLTDAERQLLLEMLCCVVAADKKISGHEVQCVTNVFTSRGESAPDKQMIVDCCKLIHKKGLQQSLTGIANRAKTLAGTTASTIFIDAQAELMSADGGATSDELRISQALVAAIQPQDPIAADAAAPDIILEDSAATPGPSILATVKSTASLAGATAERTKLATITLPAAFIELGKHSVEHRSDENTFVSRYAAIDKLLNEMTETAGKISKTATATTLAGKAQELAGKGVLVALAQKQKLQLQKLQHDLGKVVFEAKGAASGPQELIQKIQQAKKRLVELEHAPAASTTDIQSAAASMGRSAAADGDPVTAPWKVALAIMLLFPYGLYLLWNHPTLGKRKWWWRCALAWPFIVGLIGAVGSGPPKSSSTKTTATSDDSDGDYEEGYEFARGVLKDARNAPAWQKDEIMQTLEPSRYRSRSKAFNRGMAKAIEEVIVQAASGGL
jgi:hypothetical protein